MTFNGVTFLFIPNFVKVDSKVERWPYLGSGNGCFTHQ